MQAPLEIAVRLIALLLCFYGLRKFGDSIAPGRIAVIDGDIFDWYPHPDLHRATEPVRYWTAVALYGFALTCCLSAAIFGWRPYS